MKSFKFILLHIVLDAFFIIGIVYVYVMGSEGSVVIRELPVTVVAAFSIFIGVKNIGKLPLAEIFGQVSITIALFYAYVLATENKFDILASNIWFMRIIRGLIILFCFYLILNFIKRVLNSFIKCSQIFYIANAEKDFTVIESFIGATLKFKSTISVPIFNSIVRKCIQSISATIKANGNKNSEDAEEPQSTEEAHDIDSLIASLGDTALGKASKWVLNAYIDYIDECVLLYCYKHHEKSMFRSTLEAIVIFLSNGVRIIKAMSAIIIMQVIVKIILIGTGILLLFTVKGLTMHKILIGFIIFKFLEFFIQDAIIEPLMLYRILDIFSIFTYENDNLLNKLLEKFPILNKIKKLQHREEPDDLDTDDVQTEDDTSATQDNTDTGNEAENTTGSASNVYQEEFEANEREHLL